MNCDGVRPYHWLAVLPIALAGFVASLFDLEQGGRWFAPLAICGAWMLAIGARTLIRYLRANPKPDPGQEGRP